MMTMVDGLVFASAFAVAVMVIVSSIAPQWRRIMRLAAGHIEPSFQPLQTLALAERRIAVRRRVSASMPTGLRRWSEAA